MSNPRAVPGQPVRTAHPGHQPIVPAAAGTPPFCTCGFPGGTKPGNRLTDHLRRHDPSYGLTNRDNPLTQPDINGLPDPVSGRAIELAERRAARDAIRRKQQGNRIKGDLYELTEQRKKIMECVQRTIAKAVADMAKIQAKMDALADEAQQLAGQRPDAEREPTDG